MKVKERKKIFMHLVKKDLKKELIDRTNFDDLIN